VGKVILRSETKFFTTTPHIAFPPLVVHYHDRYLVYAYFIITQKVHNASAFLKYRGMLLLFFLRIPFGMYLFQQTGPTLEKELQRFVTVFMRSSLHSLRLALEKARSLLPTTSNHIACRVPLCQNCSM